MRLASRFDAVNLVRRDRPLTRDGTCSLCSQRVQ